jgi:hypothetical protein
MEIKNLLVFTLKCMGIFTCAFVITQSILWTLLSPRIGFAASSLVVLLAGGLVVSRLLGIILGKVLDFDVDLSGPSFSAAVCILLVLTQALLLYSEGGLTGDKSLALTFAWIVANSLSLFISSGLCHKLKLQCACTSGSCNRL